MKRGTPILIVALLALGLLGALTRINWSQIVESTLPTTLGGYGVTDGARIASITTPGEMLIQGAGQVASSGGTADNSFRTCDFTNGTFTAALVGSLTVDSIRVGRTNATAPLSIRNSTLATGYLAQSAALGASSATYLDSIFGGLNFEIGKLTVVVVNSAGIGYADFRLADTSGATEVVSDNAAQFGIAPGAGTTINVYQDPASSGNYVIQNAAGVGYNIIVFYAGYHQ